MTRASPLESIFFAVLEKGSAKERADYLDVVCARDPDLRQRVEKMLAAQVHMNGFLEQPAHDPLSSVVEPIAEGTVIGPYRLLEKIGEGGFGVVFMAEQLNPVRRRVALKVLKPGMDTSQVVARFEAERQALALMDHDNIARVLDAGATETGRPYFVMELVRGMPITDYCDQAKSSPQERLELFLGVISAVLHAHQKGIIHRDLKPANVLVTLHGDTPVVKVIDFGIAKAIGQELTDKTLFTGFAQMLGTPMYMAPEQAAISNVDVDTRSDIYSLGVLLYELLTGTTPFGNERFTGADYDEIRRIIREEEPPRPSARLSTIGRATPTVFADRRTDPRRLGQLVRGELDWIVMRCLEKDRNRRYESASALAADVRRYLTDEPVLACPPSAVYRFRKFARRNRAAIVGAVSAFALLIATVGALLVTNRLISREEKQKNDALADAQAQQARAETNLAKADANFQRAIDAVDKLLTRVADSRLPNQGLDPLRLHLYEDALKFYQEFLTDYGSEPQVRFEAARAYGRVTAIHTSLGHYPKAEDALKRAQALLEQLVEEFPDQPKFADELARTHRGMASILRLAGGRDGEAERHSRDAIRIGEQLVSRLPQSERMAYLNELAIAHSELGYLLMYNRKRADEGEREYRTALALYQDLINDDPAAAAYRKERASCYNSFGLFLRINSRPREAALVHRQAIDILAKLTVDFPGSNHLEEEGRSYFHLSFALWQQGQRDEAIVAATRVIELDRRMKQTSMNPGLRDGHAVNYHTLGQMLEVSGRKPEAEAAYRTTLSLAEAERAEFPLKPNGNDAWINAHFSLCRLLAASQRLEEADELFHRVMVWTPPIDRSQNLLAWRLATEADARFRDSARAVELARTLVDRVPAEGTYRNTLGVAQYRAGDYRAAIVTLEKSHALLAGNMASFNQFFLGMARWQLDEKDQARRDFDQALQWMEKNRPNDAELIRFRAEAAKLLGIPLLQKQPESSSPQGKN